MASRKTNFNVRFAITALVLFGIFVLLNAVLGSFDLGRFDVTDDRIYTISPAAERVLGDLQVPVQVKLYVTRKDAMPTGLQTLERDLVDKLAEFNVASDGNLNFAVVDPTDDEDLKGKLADKGIRPFQVQSIEKDAMGIKLVYSAMEIAYKDKEPEILPQLLPQNLETLEYDVCAAVTKLTRDIDPIVAVYSSRQAIDPQLMQMYMQMGQAPPEPEDLYKNVVQLLQQQSYDVRKVEITEASPIPEGAATLVVLAPRNLSDRQRYEIDRFVQQGGKLIVAVQNYEFNYAQARQGGFNISATKQDTGIEPLLAAWGLGVSDQLLMDANSEVLAIPSTQNFGGLRLQTSQPVQAPMQIKVTSDQFNDEVSIANGLNQLLYLWGGRIETDLEAMVEHGLTSTPLFTSSGETWEVPFTPGPLSPSAFIPDPDSDLGRSSLAVLVRGDFPTAYATGTIPPWNAVPDSVPAPPQEVETYPEVETSVVLVGCAKMFDDMLIGSVPGNALLLMNAVDALTLGDDLIQIRAKTATQRSIRPVSDGEKVFFRFLTIGLVPLLVAAFGIFRMMQRRREERVFLQAQGG